MHFIAVLNTDGGTLRTMDMAFFCADAERIFAVHEHTIECRPVRGQEVVAALEAAAHDDACDALIAGGGDGTISTAAGICFASGKPLAVLPAGTMNLFARSLDMPMQLPQALEAIASGRLAAVDIATANDRPFVHQYSVGMHSRLVRIRNGMAYSGRLTKIIASLRAIGEALRRPLRFDVAIRTGSRIERRRATAVSISNNPLSEGHLPYAEQIDGGVLGVYVVRPMKAIALARLFFLLMIGRWKGTEEVSERAVEEVTLNFPRRRKRDKAVIDGELIPLDATVLLKIHPGALPIVRPADRDTAPSMAA